MKELQRDLSVFKDIVALVKLCRIIKVYRPDILHSHTAKAGTIGRITGKIMRVRCLVHTYHGHVLHSYFSELYTKVIRFIERKLSNFTTTIITISEEQYNDIVNKYAISTHSKTRIIPLGFDFKKLVNHNVQAGSIRRELGIKKDIQLLGFVGRLVPIKNIQLLIKAVHEYSKVNPNTKLLIIGDGPERLSLEKLVEHLKMNDYVKFLGVRFELSAIYYDLDLFILTSRNEGTPVAVIEALAHGVPVVTTDVGGIQSIITKPEMGKIVSSFDPDQIALTINEMINLGLTKSRDRYLWFTEMQRNFGHRRLIGDIEKLYLNLIYKMYGPNIT